jgi:S-adenosylhomocysteine hydrolase
LSEVKAPSLALDGLWIALEQEGPPRLPPPQAGSKAAIQIGPVGDLVSTATPTGRPGLIEDQPQFFRTVVPPIFVDNPSRGAVGTFSDSPALRDLAQQEVAVLLERFSPTASIAAATPATPGPMPVLDAAAEGVPLDHFAGCDMLAVQHLYTSTVGLLDKFAQHGLAHRRMTVIGKSYSTNYRAARALVDRGANVPTTTLEQRPIDAHDEVMLAAIDAELRRYEQAVARGMTSPRLFILDDGGNVIDVIRSRVPRLASRVAAVEQTTRGIRKVGEVGSAFDFAVVDVARAWVKLDNEMPVIGLSAYDEIYRKLLHLRSVDRDPGRTISLLGFGAVGREIAIAFAGRDYDLRVHDRVRPHDLPRGMSFVADRREFLRGANVLVSATGSAPLGLADYRDLPHRAALFNAASSNDELAAREAIAAARCEQPPRRWWSSDWQTKGRDAYLGELPELLLDREYVHPFTGWVWGEFDGHVIPLGHIARRSRRDRVLHFADKDIYLANNGFVVNLTDEEDPIPARFIQPTRAALFAAGAQALSSFDDRRVHALDDAAQARIQARYDAPDAGGGGDLRYAQWRSHWMTHPPAIMPYTKDKDALARAIAASHPELARRVISAFSLSPSHFLRDGAER